jgi:hypothetical protein
LNVGSYRGEAGVGSDSGAESDPLLT